VFLIFPKLLFFVGKAYITQKQLLFSSKKLFNANIFHYKTIGKHINNIFLEEELSKKSVVAKFATTAIDGKIYQVDHYNLDVIISVGYRVKSKQGTQFRQWASQRLKDYLVNGYAINEKRLKETENKFRLAVDHPKQQVLPCIHRASIEKDGEYRLLLIC
jgi:hypothetical protein